MAVLTKDVPFETTDWRRNFMVMSASFGLCQACATTPIAFATSLLEPQVGQLGTGLLMLCSMFSSLLLGAPIVNALGAKKSLLLGMSCSASYVLLFALASLRPPGCYKQWVAYFLGCLFYGLGSGVLWTAQGTFFSETSRLIAERDGSSPEIVTAALGGRFASILLTWEIVIKLSASLLQGHFLDYTFSEPIIGQSPMFFAYAALAAATILVQSTVAAPRLEKKTGASPGFCEKLQAAFVLWPSPKIWCLGMTNLTFGFSAGYMNGYVNLAFVKKNPSLGCGSLGTMLALTCLVAAASSSLLGSLSQRVGKGPVVSLGAAMFAAIPLSVLLHPPDEKNGYWGSWLMLLFVMQGVGRAVYESTNKAVFADFFPGESSAGAFANCMMQNSFAFFASFAFQFVLADKSVLAWIVLALALLTMPGFMVASVYRRIELSPPNEPLLLPKCSPTSRLFQ